MVLALAASIVPATLAQAQKSRVGASGGGDLVWVYKLTTEGDPPASRTTIVFARVSAENPAAQATPADRIAPRWLRPLTYHTVDGSVHAAAACKDRLHVFFNDGTHMIYDPREASPCRTLPRAALPHALACDPTSDTLYALSTQPAEMDISVTGEPTSDSQDVPSVVLLKYDRGEWHRVAGELPPPLDDGNVLMTVADARVSVVQREGTTDELHYAVRETGETEWRTFLTGFKSDDGRPHALLTSDEEPVLVSTEGETQNLVLHTITEDRWSRIGTLKLSEEIQVTSPLETCVAPFGNNFLRVWTTSDDSVRAAVWELSSGDPLSPPAVVDALLPRPDLHEVHRRQDTIAYSTLAAVLILSYIRRKALVLPLPAGADIRPAEFGRRLLAFIVDGSIFLPATMVIFRPLLLELAGDLNITAGIINASPAVINELTLRWTAALAGFIVYSIIFESWWGATPGKRLLRCHVITESGGRPGIGRIVIRNVMRGVELFPQFVLIWTLVLVLVTPRRQRVGDLIAGTLVVRDDKTTH